MYHDRRVAVVVPAYREAERIAATVRRVPPWVDHVLVVDDGSDDGTDRLARDAGDGRLVVLRHARNRGVGAALATGYRAARRLGADVVAVMAGDGQMHPDDLPALVGPVALGRYDYVKGNRLRHPRAGDMPPLRRAGTALLGRLTARAVGVPGLGDSQCGYTALAGELIDRLPLERLYPRYGYPNDLLSLVALAGGRIGEADVRPVYAGERSGLRPRHALVMLGLIARAGLRRRRAAPPSRQAALARPHDP
jgi:glycosyltransferase involved in cell wall biosynthesis